VLLGSVGFVAYRIAENRRARGDVDGELSQSGGDYFALASEPLKALVESTKAAWNRRTQRTTQYSYVATTSQRGSGSESKGASAVELESETVYF
jgi:hypothetical protein